MKAVVHDGLSARARPVEALMTAGGLAVDGGEGDLETIDRTLLRRSGTRADMIVHRTDLPDWRLATRDSITPEWLECLPHVGTWSRRTRVALAAIVAATLVAAGGLWRWGDDLLTLAAPLVPASVTRPIGNAVVGSLGGKTCNAAAGNAALDRLVARLQPNGSVEPVSVAVLDTAAVNALAAPGGRIVVFRGLIDKAAGPDEVAGVLAHELSHVALRHPAKALIRAMGLSLIVRALGGDIGGAVDVAGVLRSSRAAERDADAGALDLLGAAHITPLGLADFFRRMHAERSRPGDAIARAIDFGMSYADSHPGASERIATFTTATTHAGSSTPAMSVEDWNAVRRICAR